MRWQSNRTLNRKPYLVVGTMLGLTLACQTATRSAPSAPREQIPARAAPVTSDLDELPLLEYIQSIESEFDGPSGNEIGEVVPIGGECVEIRWSDGHCERGYMKDMRRVGMWVLVDKQGQLRKSSAYVGDRELGVVVMLDPVRGLRIEGCYCDFQKTARTRCGYWTVTEVSTGATRGTWF